MSSWCLEVSLEEAVFKHVQELKFFIFVFFSLSVTLPYRDTSSVTFEKLPGKLYQFLRDNLGKSASAMWSHSRNKKKSVSTCQYCTVILILLKKPFTNYSFYFLITIWDTYVTNHWPDLILIFQLLLGCISIYLSTL